MVLLELGRIHSKLNTFRRKLKKLRGNKNITTNIDRIQVYYSIICGYF